MTEDKEYDLSKSKEKLGALVPVIKDAHGNIVDGFTRKSIDPDWPEVTSDLITDPIQLECSRLATNFARRTKWTEDDVKRLNFIAETIGWKPKEIAENTGISYRTIMKYVSEEFKERPGVGGPVARVQLKPEETQKTHDFGKPKLYRCGFPDCQKGAYYPKFYDDIPVCSDCDKKIQQNPSLAERLKEKPSQPQRIEKHEYKAPETGEFKRARMKISPSKIDVDMYERSQRSDEIKKLGWEVIFQEPFILTKSDLTFKRGEQKKVIFFDHEKTHKNKRDLDQERREFLMKTHPHVEAIGIDYKDTTKLSEDEIFVKLLEVLK